MTPQDIAAARLYNQRIETSELSSVKELVARMGAIQAQDFAMATLAIGLRLTDATHTTVEMAFNAGEIVRAHLMRPTWHIVAADDLHWMLKLTAPRIKSSLTSRHKNLEIDTDILRKANTIIEQALLKERYLTREELDKRFTKGGIKTTDNRLYHLLFCAEMEGLVCNGPLANGKQTYALLHERVPLARELSYEESLATLAGRYFTSHGPATLQDFVWWSGLSLTQSRQALELIKTDLVSVTAGTETYWMGNAPTNPKPGESSIHLLPAFDEFLISYRDRSASLMQVDNPKVVSSNGIFRPVVVINGQVSGLWKRSHTKNHTTVDVTLFRSHDNAVQEKIQSTIPKLEILFGKNTRLLLSGR